MWVVSVYVDRDVRGEKGNLWVEGEGRGLLHCCWSAKKARRTRPTRTREKMRSAVLNSLPVRRVARRMMYVGMVTENRRTCQSR